MKIAIVEDEALFRDLLRKVSSEEFGCSRPAIAGDGEAGLRLIQDESPDLVLLDIRLPRLDGFEVLQQLRKRGSTPAAIFLSALCNPYIVVRTLQSEAQGFIDKQSTMIGDLVTGIETVLRGQRFFSAGFEAIRQQSQAVFSLTKILSEQEQRILAMLTDGMPEWDVAQSLHLSRRTIDSHCTNLRWKLAAGSKRELLLLAREVGLTQNWRVPLATRGGPTEYLPGRL